MLRDIDTIAEKIADANYEDAHANLVARGYPVKCEAGLILLPQNLEFGVIIQRGPVLMNALFTLTVKHADGNRTEIQTRSKSFVLTGDAFEDEHQIHYAIETAAREALRRSNAIQALA